MTDAERFNMLRSTLVQFFSSSSRDEPSLAEVRDKAKQLAPILDFAGDLDAVVNSALPDIRVRMGIGESLVQPSADHDPEWTRRISDWTYWDNYARFLRESGLNSAIVRNLGQVTENVLSYVQDPDADGEWDRRGLVIGHVQSGKTANYLGLVARAADAGYRFIVIVAGIHNSLRSQTQERVDKGFVGRSSVPGEEKQRIGVGLYDGHPSPVALTNVISDFRKADAGRLRSSLRILFRIICVD